MVAARILVCGDLRQTSAPLRSRFGAAKTSSDVRSLTVAVRCCKEVHSLAVGVKPGGVVLLCEGGATSGHTGGLLGFFAEGHGAGFLVQSAPGFHRCGQLAAGTDDECLGSTAIGEA